MALNLDAMRFQDSWPAGAGVWLATGVTGGAVAAALLMIGAYARAEASSRP